jgi:hypothetical protein
MLFPIARVDDAQTSIRKEEGGFDWHHETVSTWSQ